MTSKSEMAQARHILVQHEFEAKDLQRKIKEGASFDDLARKFSTCPSSKQGGDLGTFGRGQMVQTFEDAVFSMSAGEISEPIRTPFGFHLIQRVK